MDGDRERSPAPGIPDYQSSPGPSAPFGNAHLLMSPVLNSAAAAAAVAATGSSSSESGLGGSSPYGNVTWPSSSPIAWTKSPQPGATTNISLMLPSTPEFTPRFHHQAAIASVNEHSVAPPAPATSSNSGGGVGVRQNLTDSGKRGRPRADVIKNLCVEGSSSPSEIKCVTCHRVFPREKSLQVYIPIIERNVGSHY